MHSSLVMHGVCKITVRVRGYWMCALMSDFKVLLANHLKLRRFLIMAMWTFCWALMLHSVSLCIFDVVLVISVYYRLWEGVGHPPFIRSESSMTVIISQVMKKI